MRAIVVGAGIGGLAATLSLRRAGCAVTLVEQAPRFTEIGAGIQLAPTATRVLRRLGLLDAVTRRSHRPSRLSFRTWSDGHPLFFAGNPGLQAGRECDPRPGGAKRRSSLRLVW